MCIETPNKGHSGTVFLSFVRRLSSLGGPKCIGIIGIKYFGTSNCVLYREIVPISVCPPLEIPLCVLLVLHTITRHKLKRRTCKGEWTPMSKDGSSPKSTKEGYQSYTSTHGAVGPCVRSTTMGRNTHYCAKFHDSRCLTIPQVPSLDSSHTLTLG